MPESTASITSENTAQILPESTAQTRASAEAAGSPDGRNGMDDKNARSIKNDGNGNNDGNVKNDRNVTNSKSGENSGNSGNIMDDRNGKNDKNDTNVKNGKKRRKLIGLLAAAAVLIAAAVGIGIYNAPSNRMNRALDLGARYLEEQNYEQALVEFDKVIAIDPMNVDAYLGKAEAYEGMGDTEQLLAVLQTGYEQTGDSQIKTELTDTYLEQASGYEQSADYESALTVYDKLQELDGEDQKIQDSLSGLLLKQASDYAAAGDYESALMVYDELLELDGENQKVQDSLRDLLLEQASDYAAAEDYESALTVYDKLLELDGDNSDVQRELVNFLNSYLRKRINEGNYDEARVLIARYQDKVLGVDYQTILDEIFVQENISLLLKDKRYDDARALIEDQRGVSDDTDFHKMLDSLEEQIVVDENSIWVDDLYEKMIAGDINAVFSIITAPDFLGKCSVFSHEEDVWCMQYALLTSDGKVVGVYEPLEDDDYFTIAIAYCVHGRSDWELGCPNAIRGGDYLYEIVDGKREWLIENKYCNIYGDAGEWPANEVYLLFHV